MNGTSSRHCSGAPGTWRASQPAKYNCANLGGGSRLTTRVHVCILSPIAICWVMGEGVCGVRERDKCPKWPAWCAACAAAQAQQALIGLDECLKRRGARGLGVDEGTRVGRLGHLESVHRGPEVLSEPITRADPISGPGVSPRAPTVGDPERPRRLRRRAVIGCAGRRLLLEPRRIQTRLVGARVPGNGLVWSRMPARPRPPCRACHSLGAPSGMTSSALVLCRAHPYDQLTSCRLLAGPRCSPKSSASLDINTSAPSATVSSISSLSPQLIPNIRNL